MAKFRWIVHGNLVTPTRNPFQGVDDPGAEWLGPGLRLFRDHYLCVTHEGTIYSISPDACDNADEVIRLTPTQFLIPGLVDLHFHAPQFSYAATDRPLTGPDGWLETYTFPAERNIHKHVYERVVPTTLAAGTTTAVYWATLHLKPTQELVDVVKEHGQRAWVGLLQMDRNAPNDYVLSTEENMRQTREFLESFDGADTLVQPILTPRFIPTCTPALLKCLGQLVPRYAITTHVSESLDEVAWSKQLEGGASDTQVLDQHGLLSNQCILAHAVHCSDADFALLKKRGSAIAHCPLSNIYFANGTLRCRSLLERGNRVGLATDVSGGYSPSLWNAQRTAVLVSHLLGEPLDHRHAFYLATLGGAEALNCADVFGSLREGLEFDALVVDAPNAFPDDSIADLFQKVCLLGDDRHVRRVFVRGQQTLSKQL